MLRLVFVSYFILSTSYASEHTIKDELSSKTEITKKRKLAEVDTASIDNSLTTYSLTSSTPVDSTQTEKTFITSGLATEACYGINNEEVEKCFQQSDKLVCIMEFGKNFKRLNDLWTATLGWTIDELLTTPYYQLIHPHDLTKTQEYEQNFVPTGFVNRYLCKDGSYRWLSWTAISNLDKSTKHHTPFSIVIDVTTRETERQQKEEDAQAGLRKVHLLQEQALFQKQVMQSVVELQKLYRGEFAEQPNEESLTLYLNYLIQSFINLTRSQYGFTGVVVAEDDKTLIPFKVWKAHPEPQIKLSHNFELLTQEVSSSPYFIDIINTIIASKEPMLINKASDTLHLPSIQSFLGIPLVSKRNTVGIITLFNSPTGYDKTLLEWLEPLFLTADSIVNDMRSTYFKEEARKQSIGRELADAQNQAKSAFLAHMSHELRTPLGGMLGLLDLIDNPQLTPKELEYIAMAKSSGTALLTIINDILDLSKIEQGKLELEERDLNFYKIVQEVTELLAFTAEQKGLVLKTHIDPQIPNILVGDASRLRQILINLIGNAIKFTPKGSIHLDIKGAVAQTRDNKTLYAIHTQIKDTGIGMSKTAQESLFTAFSQEDVSISRRFGGTGLGLFITKKLCEMMGGSIDVISEQGLGSTFNFHVNLKLPETTNYRTLALAHQSIPETLPPLKILIAEDNKVNQTILKGLLKRGGCKALTTIENGRETVAAVTKDRYDLILMDGSMPEMDGIEATRHIRQRFSKEQLIIIGVTAHAMKEDRERFLAAGMNGYVTKPVNKEQLYAEIYRCLAENNNAMMISPRESKTVE